MSNTVLEQFSSPPAEYRSAPFWSWNGEMDPERLRRQVQQFKAAGMGGFFMHSRTGLATPYLGKRWFECVKACVEEAKTLGMKAFLYDEDRWASGSAGGRVTQNRAFRSNYLAAVEMDDVSHLPEGEIMAIFEAEITAKAHARAIKKLATIPGRITSGKKLVCFVHRYAADNPWYNNSSYLDTMNPDAVAEFIRLTHEVYFQAVGDEFGKTIPAIFTDEPHFGILNAAEKGALYSRPWTPKLPELFQERFHYDVREYLMEIFYHVEEQEHPPAQYHYMELLTSLFVGAYAKQIGHWCETHGIDFTGHVFWEEALANQAHVVGSAMRFYEYMQRPGIDQLCEDWMLVFESAKQLSSVAHQLGKRWRVTETYGCTGWDFPFAGHKMLGDYQCVLGINVRCQHLAWYTMAGEAKRDFPAAISAQSGWFPDYHVVEDYFARLNLFHSAGTECRELLVLHPVESMWLALNGDFANSAQVKELDKRFIALRNLLLSNQLDYDYGDEDILSRHAAAKMVDGMPVLEVGQARYKAVLLASMLTIRKSTLQLLRQFHALGGVILSSDLDYLPRFVDAYRNESVQRELRDMLQEEAFLPGLDATVRRLTLKVISGTQKVPAGVLYQLRQQADGWGLTLCNTGYEAFPGLTDPVLPREKLTAAYQRLEVSVKIDFEGEWFELNPETGGICQLKEARVADGVWRFETSLCALKTRLFLCKPPGVFHAPEYQEMRAVESVSLPMTPVPYRLTEPNVVVLDHAKWRLTEDSEWGEEDFVLNIEQTLRRHLKLTANYASNQPWTLAQPWTQDWTRKIMVPQVFLLLEFDIDQIPSGECLFALERADVSRVSLNGVELAGPCGYWVDESLQTLRIPAGALKHGNNQIEISLPFDYRKTGLIEAMYLLGDFGVTTVGPRSTLVARPETLQIGDCTVQGLPNYTGNIIYHTQFHCDGRPRLACRVDHFGGVAVKVRVNGRDAGMIWTPPYELELTKFLRPGPNGIEFEVLGSRRNSHGPFYAGEKHITWHAPDVMRVYKTSQRVLVESGLLSAPVFLLGCQSEKV